MARSSSTPIRRSARGEDCTILLPHVCNGDRSTVVLCHSNALADGKGMRLKSRDDRGAYGCSACHDVVDGRAPRPAWLTRFDVLRCFAAGVATTRERLRAKGLLPPDER